MKTKLVAVLFLFAAACGSDNTSNSGGSGNSNDTTGGCTAANAQSVTAISIADFAFSPACVSVKNGASVTFTNQDTAPHTATTKSGSAETFDSGQMAKSDQFAHTFTTAGTDTVYCTNHPSMTPMTIIVQ